METRSTFCPRSIMPAICMLLAICLTTSAVSAFAQAAKPAGNPPATQSSANIPPPPKWPAEFTHDGNRLVIYQPQLREWTKFRDLTCDTAVMISAPGEKPAMGVVTWRSTTLTDTQARIVLIKDFSIISARFPSLDAADAAAMERRIRQTFTQSTMTISLDRMLAGVKAAQTPAHTAAISTQPPPIFVSTKPAILLFVDGEALRVPIAGTNLSYVVNTTWDLIYDNSDYYLLDEKMWLKGKDLAGPWKVTTDLPHDLAHLPPDPNWNDVRAMLAPETTGEKAPQVFFSQKPAELLLFKGNPVYTKISGTNLSYANNTESDVFMNSADNKVYVLASGRWFRAANLQGPWTYAGDDLPKDFAKIPPNNPRAHVLVSVPGTQAARDAVLLAQVPTTAIVNRAEAEAKVKVVYTGEPQFKPIEGTSLSYAANTQEKIIKVGDLYYLCFQGVWFVAANPNGPWKTADSVPKEIYQIPSSAPVYNVTYVTQTNPTPTTVESSYTSGYVGMFVLGAAVGACIAYGTGYYYPPYYYWGPYPYPVYYPYPYSYGYRAVYNPATGAYAIGGAVYGPYGSAGRAAWYNPATGTYGRAATVQTPYGGRTVAQAYNPYTGTYGATAQGHNAYAQWGSSVVTRGDDWARTAHITTDQGTAARFRTSDGTSGHIVHTDDGNRGIVKTDNNIYAGKDGNVYKRDSNGNWSKYDDGNWTPVDKSNATGRKTGGEDSVQKSREGQKTTPTDRSAAIQERAQASGVTRESAAGAAATWQQQHQGTTPASERSRDQAGTRQQNWGSVSPDTQRQLSQDARSRQTGAQREQMHSRSAGSFSGAGSGMRMGGRRR